MPSNIESRVVEMRFDNKQFESAIAQSEKSIQRLESSLKLDDSSKSVNALGTAIQGLGVQFNSLTIDNLQKRFSTFGIVGMRVIENLTDSAMRMASNLWSVTFGQIKAGGVKRAMSIEDARFTMQGLLKDEERVQNALDIALKSVDGTAYAFDDAAKAASVFVTSGLESERLAGALKALAGTAAVTNSDYASLADIFTTVASNGRLMGDQLRQLSNRGLGTKAVLADFFNGVNSGAISASENVTRLIKEVTNGAKVGEADIQDFVSKGKVSFEIFAEAMETNFGDQAKKANETFTGALSNVRAALSRIGAEFVSPLVVQNGPLVNMFNALRVSINRVKAQIGPLSKTFVSAVTSMANSVTDFLRRADIETFMRGIRRLFKASIAVWDTMRDAFGEVFPQSTKKNVNDFIEDFASLSLKIKDTVENSETLKNVFKGFAGVISIIGQFIKALISELKRIVDSLSPVFNALSNASSAIGAWISDFAKSLEEANAFNRIFESLHNYIGKYINGIATFISDVASQFGLFSKIKIKAPDSTDIDAFFENTKAKLNPLKIVIEGVANIFGKLGNLLKGVGPTIVSFAKSVGAAINGLFSSIFKDYEITDKGIFTIFTLLSEGMLLGAIREFIGLIKYFFKATTEGPKLVSSIRGIFSGLSSTLLSFSRKIKAESLKTIAISIGILAASLLVLSGIDEGKLVRSLGAITALFAELFAFFKAFTTFINAEGLKGIAKTSGTMVALSISVLILSVALKKISSINKEDLLRSLGGVMALIAGLTASMIAISKLSGKMKVSAIGMIALAFAVKILASAVAALANIETDGLIKGLMGVFVILFELVLFMRQSKEFGKFGILQALGILILSAALKSLSKAIESLGGLDPGNLTQGLIGLFAILTEISVFAESMSKSKGLIGSAIGIAIIAVSMGAFVTAISSLGGLDLATLGKGLLAIGGVLFILSTALNSMSGTLGGSIAMLLAAKSLSAIAPALERLGSLKLTEIGKGLLAIAGVFAVVGIAAMLLAPLAPVIAVLSLSLVGISAAVTLASAAIALLSVGIFTLSAALTMLISVGAMAVSHITLLVGAIVTGIGEGIISVLRIITENGKTIVDAAVTIISSIAKALGDSASVIVGAIGDILNKLIDFLLTYVPKLVSTGVTLLLGFLSGMAENIGKVVYIALQIIANFINGLAEGLPLIIDAAFNLIISFIDGLATAIDNNTDRFIAALNHLFESAVTAAIKFLSNSVSEFFKVGGMIVQGLIDGVESLIGGIGDIGKKIGDALAGGTEESLEINSPSLRFERYGMYSDLGLIAGVEAGMPEVIKAGHKLGDEYADSVIETIQERMKAIENLKVPDPIKKGLSKGSAGALKYLEYQGEDAGDAFNDGLEKSLDLDGLFSDLGTGGSVGGGTSKSTEEVKELFDVMKHAGNVVEQFVDTYSGLNGVFTDTDDVSAVARESVQKLAETIYDASIEGDRSAKQFAKGSAEYLSAVKEAYEKAYDGIKSAVQGSMSLFEKFKKESAIGPKELLRNMQSNITGVQEWTFKMERLALRGIDQALYRSLAEAGPSSAKYVDSYLKMTADELKKAGDIYSKYLLTPEQATAKVMAYMAMNIQRGGEIIDDTIEATSRATDEAAKSMVITLGNSMWEVNEMVDVAGIAIKRYSDTVTIGIDGVSKLAESGVKTLELTRSKIDQMIASYTNLRDTLQNSVASQIDMFKKLELNADMTISDVMETFRSNIDGMKQYKADMERLAARGVEEEILSQLASMGLEGYAYIHAFADASDDELTDALESLAEGLMMKESLGTDIADTYAEAGLMAAQGFSGGIIRGTSQAYADARAMAEQVLNGIKAAIDPEYAASLGEGAVISLGTGLSKMEPATTAATTVGSAIVSAIDTALNLNEPNQEAGKGVNDDLVSGMTSNDDESTQKAENIGMNICLGVAKGIEDYKSTTINAAVAMALEALESAEDALGIESPSKAFERLGMFADLGAARGFNKYSDVVSDSAVGVAEDSLRSMRSVVKKIIDTLNGEMDFNPTIHPVLDLSGIQGGSALIGQMLRPTTAFALANGIQIQNGPSLMHDAITNAMLQGGAGNAAHGNMSAPITINVYGAPGQDVEELANIVDQKIAFRVNRLGAVWGGA